MTHPRIVVELQGGPQDGLRLAMPLTADSSEPWYPKGVCSGTDKVGTYRFDPNRRTFDGTLVYRYVPVSAQKN
jgi:hypothetical protein